MSNEEDYKVGYGKPPKKHQFKKGEGGKRKGRPPGSLNDKTLLNRALDKKIKVNRNGKTVWMTKREAGCEQIANKFASGDPKILMQFIRIVLLAGMEKEKADQRGYFERALAELD